MNVQKDLEAFENFWTPDPRCLEDKDYAKYHKLGYETSKKAFLAGASYVRTNPSTCGLTENAERVARAIKLIDHHILMAGGNNHGSLISARKLLSEIQL